MIKFKTTAKAVREGYPKALAIPYCELQHLLNYKNPIAYNSGTYGWNFDLYIIGNVAITTGYRNLVGDRVDYEVYRKYDKEAALILSYNDKRSYEEKVKALDDLLHNFIEEVTA